MERLTLEKFRSLSFLRDVNGTFVVQSNSGEAAAGRANASDDRLGGAVPLVGRRVLTVDRLLERSLCVHVLLTRREGRLRRKRNRNHSRERFHRYADADVLTGTEAGGRSSKTHLELMTHVYARKRNSENVTVEP